MQMMFPSDKVVANLRRGSAWAEFLLFTFWFMVHMPPPVLVPAPERRGFLADPFKMPPSGLGKPRRNHRQAKGHPIARKEIHEPNKISSRDSDIIGAEKNVTRSFGVNLFKGGTETAIHPGG